jgi:hypothetical protein
MAAKRIAGMALGLLLAALALPTLAIAQDATGSRNERAADKAARADLLSVLERFEGPGQSIRGHTFTTRPYGTRYKGVCRVDMLSVEYAPVVRDGDPAHATSIRPYGLTMSTYFHMLDPEPVELSERSAERAILDGRCARLKSRPFTGWIFADDAKTVANGWRAFRAMASRIHDGTLEPTRCELHQGGTCLDTLKQLLGEAPSIDGIVAYNDARGKACYQLSFGGDIVRVIMADWLKSITPGNVEAVEVVQGEIIVT